MLRWVRAVRRIRFESPIPYWSIGTGFELVCSCWTTSRAMRGGLVKVWPLRQVRSRPRVHYPRERPPSRTPLDVRCRENGANNSGGALTGRVSWQEGNLARNEVNYGSHTRTT